MSRQTGSAKRHVALRKRATETGIIAELLTLLETVTEDGRITDEEAAQLRRWLDLNCDSDLPAIDFLRTVLNQILADGKVTPEERKALHSAVERVLPIELREKAKGRRRANELLQKVKEREERAARRALQAEEWEKNHSVYSLNFMVRGVLYEGRAEVVDRHLQPGQTVFLAHDPLNPHDANAVEVLVRQGYQIGFVPREDAEAVASLLDAGYQHAAHCTKILRGRKAPIPVVQAHFYRGDATVDGAVRSGQVPARARFQAPESSGSGCLIGAVVGLIFILFMALISC